jgi:peptidoglycan-N-acetylglucosamine deacetylase
MKILTFDIEEWFHILDNKSTRFPKQWSKYEIRIHANMDRIFSILDKTNSKATFFCLGWIAECYPEIVRDIVSRGYEIASHSNLHQLVYNQKPVEFKKDVERSVKTLEDISGIKVTCFRAPGFSIREENKWAFEVLSDLGITTDCSIFPAPRSHGGFPSFKKCGPTIVKYNGIILKELPVNYIKILGYPVMFSGGGYFRLVPYPLIRQWTRESDYVMSYLHPRDFDATQPVINDLALTRKFKSYVGLNGAAFKLEKWLQEFVFTDIGTVDQQIDWSRVPEVEV